MRDYVNDRVAVAVDNGLIVPNIKDADQMKPGRAELRCKGEAAGKAEGKQTCA